MKVKLFILLVLGALATSTAAWAAAETQKATPAKADAEAKAETCCGFCIPGLPCEFCD